MCAIPQLVSAPLNPIPIAEHFRRSHPQCEHSYGQHIVHSAFGARWLTRSEVITQLYSPPVSMKVMDNTSTSVNNCEISNHII